jgi:hypothetical protein
MSVFPLTRRKIGNHDSLSRRWRWFGCYSLPDASAARRACEATYSVMIQPGEEIIAGKNEHFRVVAVVPFEEEDESPFVGLLQIMAA